MGAIAAAVIVLCGAIVLLQWHSIQFWVAQVGLTGVGFSLLLDAMGLWLWYQRTPLTRGLGVLASVLVLAGPIYWVATPIIDQSARAMHNDAAVLANISALETEIAQRESVLSRMSVAPGGADWAAVIRQTQIELSHAVAEINRMKAENLAVPAGLTRTYQTLRADLRKYQHAATRGADSVEISQRAQAELTDRRARLAELRSVNPSVQSEERAMIVVAMQVFALLLFQLGAVLAINRISVLRAAMTGRPELPRSSETTTNQYNSTATVNEDLARKLPVLAEIELTPRVDARPARPSVKAVKTSRVEKINGKPVGASAPLLVAKDADSNIDNALLLRHARRTLENELTQSSVTHEQMAVNLGISPNDLRMFLQHEELLAQGERTLSKPIQDRILTLYTHALKHQNEAVD